MTNKVNFSEQNPYNMAVWIQGLFRAAKYVAEDIGDTNPQSGLSPLMDVIDERLDRLVLELDRGAFSERWPELEKYIDSDPSLKNIPSSS